MKVANKNITQSAENIRSLKKKHKTSNETLRELLHYSNVKSVSYILSGKQRIQSDGIHTLSQYYKVSEAFIAGETLYPDNETLNKWMDILDSENRQQLCDYLSTLNATIKPVCVWHTTALGIFFGYSEMKSYLSEDTQKKIEQHIDFNSDPNTIDDKEYITLELQNYIPTNIKAPSQITKKDCFTNRDSLNKYIEIINWGYIETLYRFSRYQSDNKYQTRYIDVNAMHYIFSAIDDSCRAILNNILDSPLTKSF